MNHNIKLNGYNINYNSNIDITSIFSGVARGAMSTIGRTFFFIDFKIVHP